MKKRIRHLTGAELECACVIATTSLTGCTSIDFAINEYGDLTIGGVIIKKRLHDLGHILYHYNISLEKKHDGWWVASYKYNYEDEPQYMYLDKDPLVAVMQCLIALKLDSDEVELPDHLFGDKNGSRTIS